MDVAILIVSGLNAAFTALAAAGFLGIWKIAKKIGLGAAPK